MRNRRGAILFELVISCAVFALGIGTLYPILFRQMKVARSLYEKGRMIHMMEGEMLHLKRGGWKLYTEKSPALYTHVQQIGTGLLQGSMSVAVEESGHFSNTLKITLFWHPDTDTKMKNISVTSFVYRGKPDE